MWLSTARMALGVIAIALSLVLGFVYLISVRRLEREVARLSQQTEGLSGLVVRAQGQQLFWLRFATRTGFGHTKAACSGARTAGGATA